MQALTANPQVVKGTSRHTRSWIWVGVILLVLVVALGSIVALVGDGHRTRRTLAVVPPKPVVRVVARGRLEPANGIIGVAAAGVDRLREVRVREGDEVREGQELAFLDSYPLRKIEFDLGALQEEEARERLARVEESGRLQIEEIDLRIRQLEEQGPRDLEIQKAKVELLARQLKGARDLQERMRRSGSYSLQELEQQDLVGSQADLEHRGAVALLDKIRKGNETGLATARAQRDNAVAGLKRARSEISLPTLAKNRELAAERLKLAVVRAPAKGRILKVLARPGEMVGAQPVFQLADTSSMVAVTEVYETEIELLRQWHQLGNQVRATIRTRALQRPEPFHGIVEQIGTMVARNTMFSLDPRHDADRRVVEVRIRLEDRDAGDATHFINMQVDVIIHGPDDPNAP